MISIDRALEQNAGWSLFHLYGPDFGQLGFEAYE